MRISDWSSDVCSSDLRWLYRVARKHAGRQLNGWRFELRHLHAKSASQSRFSDFALHIRAIVRSQSLPGYVLELVPGTGSETLLVMRPSVIEIGLRPVDNLPRQKRRIGTSDAMPIGTSNAVLSRSEEHTSEHKSLMRISYAVFCLKKK